MQSLRIPALCAVAILFAGAASAATQSPFDGTWTLKASGSRIENGRRVTFTLKDGKYKCDTCTPAIEIAADGKPHAVKGHRGFDAEAARVVDGHTLAIKDTKHGGQVHAMTVKASRDGKHLVVDDRYFINGHEMREIYRMTRTEPAPKGTDAMSGTWQKSAFIRLPNQSRGIKMHIAKGYLDINLSGNGPMQHLKLGGPAQAIQAGSMVKIKASLSGPRTLHLVTLIGGKPVMRQTLEVAGNGKTLQLQGHNLRSGMKITMTADRQ